MTNLERVLRVRHDRVRTIRHRKTRRERGRLRRGRKVRGRRQAQAGLAWPLPVQTWARIGFAVAGTLMGPRRRTGLWVYVRLGARADEGVPGKGRLGVRVTLGCMQGPTCARADLGAKKEWSDDPEHSHCHTVWR
jgi:hypothetical protein